MITRITSTASGKLKLITTTNRTKVCSQSMPCGLLFYKDFRTVGHLGVDADYSIGSSTGVYTVSRGASNPATYIDANGNIKLVTTSDVPLISYGYYDATGFKSKKMILMEQPKTNALKDSYFANATITANWRVYTGSGTLAHSTDYANPYLGGQVAKFVSSDIGDSFSTAATNRPSIPVSQTQCISMLVRGSGTIKLMIEPDGQAKQYGSAVVLNGNWQLLTLPYLSTATLVCNIGFELVAPTATVYVAYVQSERYGLTSFIPTTTSALTRNFSSLNYALANNISAVGTIFIKGITFTEGSKYQNDGVIFATNAGSVRRIFIPPNYSTFGFMPNATNSSAAYLRGVNNLATEYKSFIIFANAISSTGSPNSSLYLDNVSIDSTSAGNTDWTANTFGDKIYIGSLDGTQHFFSGGIEVVAIFNRALSVAEMTALYNSFL